MLEFVGDDAQQIAAHVQQHVHAGLDADPVRGGGKDAVSYQPQLVGMRHKPLGVGGGNVGAQVEHARA
jgi:hypothetical protein